MSRDSLLKDDSIDRRRGSSVASEEPDFGANGGGGDLDFDMDTSGQQLAPTGGGLSVDTSKDDESSKGRTRRRSNLGDLELSGLEEEDTSKTGSAKNKRKRAVNGRRMKKRRKIVIDNNQTELTSEQMKAMLRDTSDIVMQNVQHLAAWPRDDVDEEEDAHLGICPALQRLSAEQLLARPCIGDDDGLATELLAMWGRNMCKITGKAGTQLPFRMRKKQPIPATASPAATTTSNDSNDDSTSSNDSNDDSLHNDVCEECHHGGILLCCDSCTATFHLECVGLIDVPMGDWICNYCLADEEKEGLSSEEEDEEYRFRSGDEEEILFYEDDDSESSFCGFSSYI